VSSLGGLASLAGIHLGGSAGSAESIALLSSRKLQKEFIEQKQLLPTLFPEAWDKGNGSWRSNDVSKQPDIRDAVDFFAKEVSKISVDGSTGFVTLSIDWTDPQLAADWCMEIVERANEAKRQRDIQEQHDKLTYLGEQLAAANLIELREAIARVMEDQISAMTMAQSQAEYAFRILDPAVTPKKPVWPQRTLILIAGIALGTFVGLFLVAVRVVAKKAATGV
jgi:uncharacterized protein involved in exopolysaccharide biosynthesis